MKVKYWMTIYQKKHRYQKGVEEDRELNLASLLDVLVIILFFLILNYNPTDLQIRLTDKISPPGSLTNEYGYNAVTIQVGADKELSLDGTVLGNLSSSSLKSKAINALKNSKANQELMYKNSSRAPSSTYDAGTINIIFDGDLDFDIVHNVMAMSSAGGFTTFKLIVRGGGADVTK